MNNQQYIDQLFNTLGQLRKLLETHSQESHAEKTATIMQFSALRFLKSNTESTVGSLAAYLSLSKSSATQLAERLVKMGFVTRINDQKDRRIVHLVITTDGEQKIKDLKKKFMDKMGKIFSKVPDEDLQELIRIHTNLVEILKKENK